MHWLQRDHNPSYTWSQQLHWILIKAKGRTKQAHLLRMIYAESVPSIWCERNARVFENEERTVESLAGEIACISNVRANAVIRGLLQRLHF